MLPHLPLSTEVAEEAHRRGDQVLLHLPMQSESDGAKPEDIELRVGMNSGQVSEALTGMLESVPHVAGVNNHQGSRATADPALLYETLEAPPVSAIDHAYSLDQIRYNVNLRADIDQGKDGHTFSMGIGEAF